MFDTYGVQDTQYVPYAKTVNEHKAPTDDSIKLYGEFIEKARTELVERGRCCSNEVNVTYNIYRDNFHDTMCCYYNLVINGKLVSSKFEISPFYYNNRHEFFEELKLQILEVLGNYIIMTIDKTSGNIRV